MATTRVQTETVKMGKEQHGKLMSAMLQRALREYYGDTLQKK